jgi:hypothetical protein
MMRALPGERLVRQHVPGDWRGEDAQAAATLRAAAHYVCQHLLPVDTPDARTWAYVVAVDGTPAVLQIDVFTAIGLSDLSLRVTREAETAAGEVLDRIRQQALQMAPAALSQAEIPACDELPF